MKSDACLDYGLLHFEQRPKSDRKLSGNRLAAGFLSGITIFYSYNLSIWKAVPVPPQSESYLLRLA